MRIPKRNYANSDIGILEGRLVYSYRVNGCWIAHWIRWSLSRIIMSCEP